MKAITLEQLQTFQTVVDTGSFSAAAPLLNLSQPAVSLRIRELERQVGLRLLERVGRRSTPTPAGDVVYAHAKTILQALDGLHQAVDNLATDSLGRVRLGTGVTACINLLPPVLRSLRLRYPMLDIRIRTGNSRQILDLLIANEIDICLVAGPVTDRGLQVREVYFDPFVAVGPRHAADLAAPTTPAEIAQRPLILYEHGGRTRQLINGWFAEAGAQVASCMDIDNVEAIKKLVSAGLGYSILPDSAMAIAESRKDLQIVPLDPPLGRRLELAMRNDKVLTRGLRILVEALSGLEQAVTGQTNG